jgi:hypothetical protein
MRSLQKVKKVNPFEKDCVRPQVVSPAYNVHGFKRNFVLEDIISVCYGPDLYSASKQFLSWLGYHLS